MRTSTAASFIIALVTLFALCLSSTPNVAANDCNADGLEPYTFDRILILNFENRGIIETMWQPFFRKVARNLGSLLGKYYGVTHPSQPNYLAQIAGDYFGHKTDKNLDLPHLNLVDQLDRKGVTWKSYQENYPTEGSGEGWNEHGCFMSSKSLDRLYYRKHNPFLSFVNVSNNRTRCSRIVNSEQLYEDIRSRQLPQVMYYTPNIDNDGHDTGLKFANKWFEQFMTPLINDQQFMNGTLIFITFDEDLIIEFNHVYAAVVGSMVQRGFKDTNRYSHYSLLRTIQDNWQLGHLNRNDAKTTSFKCLKKQNKYKPYIP